MFENNSNIISEVLKRGYEGNVSKVEMENLRGIARAIICNTHASRLCKIYLYKCFLNTWDKENMLS
jgi:hypothetical protein